MPSADEWISTKTEQISLHLVSAEDEHAVKYLENLDV